MPLHNLFCIDGCILFYFILQIGFIQSLKVIQIWFELKMICKLENSLENRNGFNPEKWPWAENPPPA
jgi:hypothetical protein